MKIKHWTQRLFVVSAIVLVLLIPLLLVGNQVEKRQQYAEKAFDGVTQVWAPHRALNTPYLAIHYEYDTENEVYADSVPLNERKKTKHHEVKKIEAQNLNVLAQMQSQNRRKGFFTLPVFEGKFDFEGQIQVKNLQKELPKNARVLWGETELCVDVGQNQEQYRPENSNSMSPCVYKLKFTQKQIDSALIEIQFKDQIEVLGSKSIQIENNSELFSLKMRSNSRVPSFEGNLSPLDYKIGADGFNAQWNSKNNGTHPVEKQIKVRFLNGVDDYLMIERTVEYGIFVIFCLFATILAFEMVQNRSIHTIQYILVGAAQVMFYLLLLSLGEQIGFMASYIVAALMTIFLICSYIKAVLKSYLSAGILAGILSVIYGFLFIVLKSADYSLLIGSLGLFSIISILMYVTRHIHEREAAITEQTAQDSLNS